MLFRIGINLGDVLIDGDDILGDGVNIAARLEGIAEPGGICVSDDVYRQVSGSGSRSRWWKQGEDVIIAGSVSDDEAKTIYPQGWKAPKPYIRIVPQPK